MISEVQLPSLDSMEIIGSIKAIKKLQNGTVEKTGKHASSGHLFHCNLLCVLLILFLSQWNFRKRCLGSIVKEGREEISLALQTSTNFFFQGSKLQLFFFI